MPLRRRRRRRRPRPAGAASGGKGLGPTHPFLSRRRRAHLLRFQAGHALLQLLHLRLQRRVIVQPLHPAVAPLPRPAQQEARLISKRRDQEEPLFSFSRRAATREARFFSLYAPRPAQAAGGRPPPQALARAGALVRIARSGTRARLSRQSGAAFATRETRDFAQNRAPRRGAKWPEPPVARGGAGRGHGQVIRAHLAPAIAQRPEWGTGLRQMQERNCSHGPRTLLAALSAHRSQANTRCSKFLFSARGPAPPSSSSEQLEAAAAAGR